MGRWTVIPRRVSIKQRFLSWLLHLANARGGIFHQRDFYALKDRLLKKYGTRAGEDIQHIVDECWGYEDEGGCVGLGCRRCGGTSVWRERWVLLERWDFAGRMFHRPVGPLGRREPLEVTIEGRITHRDVPHKVAAGARSGLWREYLRIIGELRPSYVAVENVAALLHRGLSVILGDLARIGYDAEWSVVSACAVGAPHMRRRLLLVAYPDSEHGRQGLRHSSAQRVRPLQSVDRFSGARARWEARLANPSALYGGANGLPFGMDRNHAIGNAVVPQVAEVVGRLIAEREKQQESAA